MKDILTRAITGALFVALIIGALWWSVNASIFVMTLFLVLGLIEYFNLFKNSELVNVSMPIAVSGALVVFLCLMIPLIDGLHYSFSLLPMLLFPFIFILFLTELWRKKANPLLNIGVMSFSIFYLVIPFMFIILLSRMSSHENPLVIGMFLLIWTNDTFAYLSGRLMGKTKLFERISPKKTWEGTIGGIIFTIGVAYLLGLWGTEYSSTFWMISALIIAPCAILGDLLESLFKRSLNIKDSGTILPGHGGILDRFDATIFAVPFFYSWTMFYNFLQTNV